jgi:hypothetical protein
MQPIKVQKKFQIPHIHGTALRFILHYLIRGTTPRFKLRSMIPILGFVEPLRGITKRYLLNPEPRASLCHG